MRLLGSLLGGHPYWGPRRAGVSAVSPRTAVPPMYAGAVMMSRSRKLPARDHDVLSRTRPQIPCGRREAVGDGGNDRDSFGLRRAHKPREAPPRRLASWKKSAGPSVCGTRPRWRLRDSHWPRRPDRARGQWRGRHGCPVAGSSRARGFLDREACSRPRSRSPRPGRAGQRDEPRSRSGQTCRVTSHRTEARGPWGLPGPPPCQRPSRSGGARSAIGGDLGHSNDCSTRFHQADRLRVEPVSAARAPPFLPDHIRTVLIHDHTPGAVTRTSDANRQRSAPNRGKRPEGHGYRPRLARE
jgi:hypothetical protein